MDGLHELLPDEATIKIVGRKSGLLEMAPKHLKRHYWVCLGEGGQYEASFDTLEEALQFIKNEAVKYGIEENKL